MGKFLKIRCLAVALLLAGSVSAQGIAAFRSKLYQPHFMHSASVRVIEHDSAEDAVRTYDSRARENKVTGYRVRIFFDNAQNARNEAHAVRARFGEQFPSIKSYISYESPSWIVTVGNCVTIEEALILQNRVKHSFPTAFIWRGEIPLKEFIEEKEEISLIPLTPAAEPESQDSQSR